MNKAQILLNAVESAKSNFMRKLIGKKIVEKSDDGELVVKRIIPTEKIVDSLKEKGSEVLDGVKLGFD